MKSNLPLALLALALSAPLLSSQGTKYSPAIAENFEGNGDNFLPFLYDKTRVQHLIDGDSFTRNGGVITAFAYRRDGVDPTSYAARSIPSWTITFGHSSLDPATMSTSFATNRSGTQTTVFSGAYNLPQQSKPNGLAPWVISFKLNRPFVYIKSKGNLLIEMVAPGNAQRKNMYKLDAHAAGRSATSKTFGIGGPFASQDQYQLSAGSEKPFLGGIVALVVTGLKKAYPAVAAIGFSNTQFGTLKLPLDLSPFQAPKNSLYISLDLVIPLTLTAATTGFAGQVLLPIPANPAMSGLKVFGQALFFDATSNALGIVFSNAVQYDIGEIVSSNMLGAPSSTATTGQFLSNLNGRIMSPVIRFTGGL